MDLIKIFYGIRAWLKPTPSVPFINITMTSVAPTITATNINNPSLIASILSGMLEIWIKEHELVASEKRDVSSFEDLEKATELAFKRAEKKSSKKKKAPPDYIN